MHHLVARWEKLSDELKEEYSLSQIKKREQIEILFFFLLRQ